MALCVAWRDECSYLYSTGRRRLLNQGALSRRSLPWDAVCAGGRGDMVRGWTWLPCLSMDGSLACGGCPGGWLPYSKGLEIATYR